MGLNQSKKHIGVIVVILEAMASTRLIGRLDGRGFGGHVMVSYVELVVYVKPRAKTTGLRYEDGELVFYTTEPPVGGRANDALTEYLSKKLRVPRRNIVIVRGLRDRVKLVRVYGVDEGAVRRIIEGDS